MKNNCPVCNGNLSMFRVVELMDKETDEQLCRKHRYILLQRLEMNAVAKIVD